MPPTWITAFLDFEAGSFVEGVRFWASVAACGVSATRGEHDEFATLLPADGDAYLRVQRLSAGTNRVHLDLHVADPSAAARAAVDSGAEIVDGTTAGHVVLRSPAGVSFCFVADDAARVRPAVGPPGSRALIDQVCLDVTSDDAEGEAAFWEVITGWVPVMSSSSADLQPFVRPDGMPLRLMVQRVGDDRHPATAHLDLAVDDRAAETARHVGLGALVEGTFEHWSVLRDPVGQRYCLTDRDPDTGMLRRSP